MSAEGCRVDAGALPPLPGDLDAGPERPIRGAWHRLEQRMGLDLRSLALFRVLLGGLLLWDLVRRAAWLRTFYTDDGVLPVAELVGRAASSVTEHYYSLHAANGSLLWQVILFAIAAFAALGLLVGRRTRWMTFLSWFLLVSLHNRHPLILNAGDSLLRMLLFWSMFLPLGARWSVDSALNRDAVLEPAKRNNRLLSVPAICLIVQVCVMYWCTAALKSHAVWVEEHTAVARALSLDYMVEPLGQWMLTLPAGVLAFVTVATLVIEFGVPCLLWVPVGVGVLRTLAVLVMCGMHATFALTMDIGLFSHIACAAWMAFLPPWFWDHLFAKIRKNPKRTGATIWFDADCGFCQKAALFVRTFLLLPETRIRRIQEDPAKIKLMKKHNSWVFENGAGETAVEFDGIVAALRASPWAWLFAPLMGWKPVRAVGTAIYRVVANRRRVMGRLLGWATYAPRALAATRWRWLRDTTCVVALLFVLLMNGRIFHRKRTFEEGGAAASVATWCRDVVDPPGETGWMWLGYATRLSQSWTMFAPKPPSSRGWYQVSGFLEGDREIELYDALVLDAGLQPSTADRPERVAERYPDARWRKYMNYLRSRARHPTLFCKWLARQWKERYPDQKLLKVRLYFHRERVAGDGSAKYMGRKQIWYYTPK